MRRNAIHSNICFQKYTTAKACVALNNADIAHLSRPWNARFRFSIHSVKIFCRSGFDRVDSESVSRISLLLNKQNDMVLYICIYKSVYF